MVDPVTRKRKWIIRWLLAASLGLNLLFVGAFAGAAYRNGGGGPDNERSVLRGYAAPYVHALPRETRRALGRELRKEREGQTPISRRARRAQYLQMVTLLRQASFDLAAAEQILSTQRNAVTNMQSSAQTLWLKEVTEMSAEERTTYADELEKVLKRKPGKRNRPQKNDN